MHLWLSCTFFSKVRISFRIDFQSSTFGVFFSPKSSTFGYENFLFWSLRAQQGARTLQNHYPACFFDGPYQSCKFRPDWSTLNFFSSKGPPFGYFPDFDKMQKNWIFLFFEIRTPFFDSILRTAPGTILNHCHQVWPPVLRRNQHFDARDFVCWPAAARLLESKKWVFQNCFPFKILHEFFISCIPRHHWYFAI